MASQVLRLKRVIGWGLLLLSLGCSASEFDAANDAGKAFGESLNSSTVNNLGESINPEVAVPGYEGSDVDATQYYESGLEIENQAQQEAASNDEAQFITNARDTRPQVTIDPATDPLFKRYGEIEENSHSLSDSYSGCVDIPVGTEDVTVFDSNSCHIEGIPRYTFPKCTRSYSATCSNGATYHEPYIKEYSIRIGRFASSGTDGWGGHSIRFLEGSRVSIFGGRVTFGNNRWEHYVEHSDFNLIELCKHNNRRILSTNHGPWSGITQHLPGRLFVDPNSIYVGRNTNTLRTHDRGILCNSFFTGAGTYLQTLSFNPYVSLPDNMPRNNLVGAQFNYRVELTARCDTEFSSSYSCEEGAGIPGEFDRTECAYSGYRNINGFSIYRDCWEEEHLYRKEHIEYVEQARCGELRNLGCGFVGSQCNHRDNEGRCLDEEVAYSCPREESARSLALCGDELICQEGDCAADKTINTGEGDFQRAATALSVAQEVKDELSADGNTIFNGRPLMCERKLFGFSDCCADSGWGQDIGLARCSSEEEELGLAKEAGRTHYIGQYCSKRNLFGCIERTRVYCGYNSKLTRIIMEQGLPQLGRNFGTERSPDCRGLTIAENELHDLDFNAMDLSEFYEDVEGRAANGSAPSLQGAVEDIQQKLDQRFPGVREDTP